MSHVTAIALLAVPAVAAVVVGGVLLRLAFARPKLLVEEVALALAWAFVVGSLVWLEAHLSGSSLLGFSAPWTWLAASHFAAAGFGALTVTALSCRAVSEVRALGVLRILLVAHPAAYLVTAAGITGVAHCEVIGAASYELIFVTQLCAVVLGRPNRIARGPRRLLVVALSVPVVTLVPALAWACESPMVDLSGMVRYHGVVNAVGHVGLGLGALAWGRPPAQSPRLRSSERPAG